jgi:tetratricopeptide (TPR) repeat protein
MRLTNLGLYIFAVILMARWLEVVLGENLPALLAGFAFAVHPAHVESVAWLASRKDVLSLVCLAAALLAHARRIRHRLWLIPLLLLCAHLSKSFTVVAPALLLAQDLMLRRRPETAVYVGSIAVAVVALSLHVWVGARVGMMAAVPGGNRFATFMTMGPVWLRYVGMLVWPGALSAVHDVQIVTSWSFVALLGYALLLGWLGAGLWLWRRRQEPLWLAAWCWFVVPLLPVSQVVFPLQNLMADRYLLLSVMALALLLAQAATHPLGAKLAVLAVIALGMATAHRSALFADSVSLFEDATEKTKRSPIAPYLLGQALEERGDVAQAQTAYGEALRRAEPRSEMARLATTGLAASQARAGALEDAKELLERARQLWPNDPDLLTNLAVVLGALGRTEQARSLYRELVNRFPQYVAAREAELRRSAQKEQSR